MATIGDDSLSNYSNHTGHSSGASDIRPPPPEFICTDSPRSPPPRDRFSPHPLTLVNPNDILQHTRQLCQAAAQQLMQETGENTWGGDNETGEGSSGPRGVPAGHYSGHHHHYGRPPPPRYPTHWTGTDGAVNEDRFIRHKMKNLSHNNNSQHISSETGEQSQSQHNNGWVRDRWNERYPRSCTDSRFYLGDHYNRHWYNLPPRKRRNSSNGSTDEKQSKKFPSKGQGQSAAQRPWPVRTGWVANGDSSLDNHAGPSQEEYSFSERLDTDSDLDTDIDIVNVTSLDPHSSARTGRIKREEHDRDSGEGSPDADHNYTLDAMAEYFDLNQTSNLESPINYSNSGISGIKTENGDHASQAEDQRLDHIRHHSPNRSDDPGDVEDIELSSGPEGSDSEVEVVSVESR